MCDYEPCDVYDSRQMCARKPHRCGECGRLISPGETYQRIGVLYEGEWSTHVMCSDCVELAESLVDVGCGCWGLSSLHQDALEAVDYGLSGSADEQSRFLAAMARCGLRKEE